MAKQKEKTLEELLRKTKKLAESRPSCVLEGKASMRGPGVNDPSDDAESTKVCDTCGSQVQEVDLRLCSTCDRGFHTSCVYPPVNASMGVDWRCSQCQDMSSCLHHASEASLDSSSGIHGENAVTRILDSKLDRQDDKGENLSGSQDTSCQGSKSVASVEEKLVQLDRGQLDAIEVASDGLEDEMKSSQGDGNTSEQSPALEFVRRSKRGKPYKPVGGLHPNKRRSIDGSNRNIDRLQGRFKPVLDEEDELGAKIEKYRVISSIDERSVRTGSLNAEDSKAARFGRPVSIEERETLADISTDGDKLKTWNSSNSAVGIFSLECADIAANGTILEEENKVTVSCGADLDSTSAVRGVDDAGNENISFKETKVKLQNDSPKGLSGGSLPPTVVQGGENKASLQVESQLIVRAETMGSEQAQEQEEGQVKVESFVNLDILTSNVVLGGKDVSLSSVTNLEVNVVERVHPLSPVVESIESLPNPLDFSNNLDIVNDVVVSSNEGRETENCSDSVPKDELEIKESSIPSEGKKQSTDLFADMEAFGREKASENVSNANIGVQDVLVDNCRTDLACGDSRATEPGPKVTCGFEDQSKEDTAGGTGDGVTPAVVSTASPVPVQLGRHRDNSTGMMSKVAVLGVMKSGSLKEEELGLKGSHRASFEEDDDVKVCDICGDAGYEECLTFCSACNEGAEHIYCMQALLHAVPDDGWLCEGCKLKEKEGSLKQVGDLSVNHFHSRSVYVSPKKKQIIKGNTRSRLSALLDKGKGSSQQKVATKGPLGHQLSTKRPADDVQTAPPAKRQVRENSVLTFTATNSFISRGLSRENSIKTPDSGKVKFLSPNALTSIPAGGGSRNSGKPSAFAGLSSHCPKLGLTQAPQTGSKNRYGSNSCVSNDSVVSVPSLGIKQPASTPKLPVSVPAAPAQSTGTGAGSLKSNDQLPSFLLPSRSAHFALSKGSKEISLEGNGLHSAGGSGKVRSASPSGKFSTKWIDTPRPLIQLPTFGRPFYPPKMDTAICSQPPDGSGMLGKSVIFQKRVQTSDAAKSLNNTTRLPSLSRIPSYQSIRDEGQRSSESQDTRGSRQVLKPMDSSVSVTSRSLSIPSLPLNSSKVSAEDSHELNDEQGGSQHAKGFQDVPNTDVLDPPGVVVGNGQKDAPAVQHSGVLVFEDNKRPSKASPRVSPQNQSILDEISNGIARSSPDIGKDLKRKDSTEIGWSSSTRVASMRVTRCYKCKEIGHVAQDCSNRSTATMSLAVLCASSGDSPSSISSPKEGLQGRSSCPWGPKSSDNISVSEQTHAIGSSSDPVSATAVQGTECSGSFPVSVLSTEAQGPSKGAGEEVPTNFKADTRKLFLTPVSHSQSRMLSQHGSPTASAACGDLQPILIRKANVSAGNLLAPTCLNHMRLPEDMLGRDSTILGPVTEAQRLDTRSKKIEEISPRLLNEGSQAVHGEMNVLGGPNTPVPANLPLDPPCPTPMMIQSKSSVPWGQFGPPRPNIGFDRVVNQDARGKRVGGVTGHGIGASVSSAVPESQWLWRGGFEVVSAAFPALFDGILAYTSSFAAPKVRAVTKTLPPRLQLEEVRRMFNADAWPKQFQQKPPTDKEIALYFFPVSESFETGYMRLLEHMMACDLVLMGQVEGAEILIFPSHILPVEYHRWKSKMFLWGVYRARRANSVVTPGPLDSGQTSASVVVHPCTKVVVSEAEKFVRQGTPVMNGSGDTEVIDMEIDMIGEREIDGRQNNPTLGWEQSSSLSSPPLPQEPPPIQPPPPDQADTFGQEEKALEETSVMGKTIKECGVGDLDLPPGFGPVPQNQVCLGSGSAELDRKEIRPSQFEHESSAPPGFEKRREGILTKTLVNSKDVASSIADVDTPELTSNQITMKREIIVAEHPGPVAISRQSSPLSGPSPSPRDVGDDSVVGTSHVSTHTYSHSSSESPIRYRDKVKDQNGGRAGRGRESGRARERGRERERARDRERGRDREKGRDREQDKEVRREKDEQRRRDRWRDRERVKDREKEDWSFARDRDKHRDYKHEDRGRERESKYRHHARSGSQSLSRSCSFSVSRPILQSPSVSPRIRLTSGMCCSKHRSGSYSDSPDSNHGRPSRSLQSLERQASRQSLDRGVGTLRRVTSRIHDIGRDGKSSHRDPSDVESSHKSRPRVLSKREEWSRTRSLSSKDEVFTDTEPPGNSSSIPFYDEHEKEADRGPQNSAPVETNQGTLPYYHIFLPGESGEAPVFETDIGEDEADQPCFSKILPWSGARASSDFKVLSNNPKSETLENSLPWDDQDKALESPGYEFFPIKAANAGDMRVPPSTNPNLQLMLGERHKRNQSLPFFVPLVDMAGSSPEPAHEDTHSVGPPDLMVEFPSVSNMKEESGKVEVGSLSLTLSVPQYRKEGNLWVRIEDTDASLGVEDVDFALSL